MGLHRIRNEVIKRINVIVLAEYMVYMLASGIVDALDDKEYTGSLSHYCRQEQILSEIILRKHGVR